MPYIHNRFFGRVVRRATHEATLLDPVVAWWGQIRLKYFLATGFMIFWMISGNSL
jgi:hypothetical protein